MATVENFNEPIVIAALGKVAASARVWVYPAGSVEEDGDLIGTPSLSTIYAFGQGGTVTTSATGQANPLDTDERGQLQFAGVPARYDFRILVGDTYYGVRKRKIDSPLEEIQATAGTFSGDITAVGGMRKLVGPFVIASPGANDSATVMLHAGCSVVGSIVMPRAGSIVGISVRAGLERTAGTATFTAWTETGTTTLYCTLNASDTISAYAVQAKDTADAVFAAKERVFIKYATSSFTPNGAGQEFAAYLEVEG
jgi:hypothetical protein